MIGNNNFINECKKDKITYKEYIIIDNVQVELKAQMYQTAYKDTTFFGTFNLNYIKFTTSNDINYKNKDFSYYKVVNGETQLLGHYYVTEIKDNDTEEEIEITAFDNGIKFNNIYVTTLNYQLGNITLYDVLQECCTKCNVTLKNQSITNGSFIVDSNQFEETATYGDVICAIAQMSGGFAFINYEGKLEIRFTNETNEIIEDYIELEDKRDTHPITSVLIGIDPNIEGEYAVREDSSLVEQYGRNWLKIYGNPFAYTVQKREFLIDAIFNQVKGFGYSAFTVKDCFLPYYELGDLIQFRNKEGQLVSSIILRIETDYDSIQLSAPSITNAEIDYIKPTSDSEMTRKTRIQVDKANQQITAVIEQVGEQNEKILEIDATVDELNTKISEIADITTSQETNSGKLIFENINASEPIKISIHPIVENISNIYPSSGLFPSSHTYFKTKILRFTNTSIYEQTTDTKYTSYRKYYIYNSQNEQYNQLIKGTDYQVGDTISGVIYQNIEIDYELPSNLYYYDANNYDEFILDYGDGINKTCIVNKKVGINADGTTYLLDEEQRIEYQYPTIFLTDGNYEICLLGYETGYLFAKLMVENSYTTQFATKVEMNSAISQSATAINLSVDYKLSAYSNTIEMNSAINLSANSIMNTVSATYASKDTVEASLELKIDKNDNDQIVSMINASADVINLTAGRLLITSGNFQLDNNGNITCSGGIIGGWTIGTNAIYKNYTSEGITYQCGLYTTNSSTEFIYAGAPVPGYLGDSTLRILRNGKIIIKGGEEYNAKLNIVDNNNSSEITPGNIYLHGNNIGFFVNTNLNKIAYLYADDDGGGITLGGNYSNDIILKAGNSTRISCQGNMYADAYNYNSLESMKKNIECFNNNVLDLIINSQLYTFNYKKEDDKSKKHIGFVIGEKYKTPKEIIAEGKESINSYSMNSIMWKGIQELYKEIQELKERIK